MSPKIEPPAKPSQAASSRRALVIRGGVALLFGFALWWALHDTTPPEPPAPPRTELAVSPSPPPSPAAVTASPPPTPATSGAHETALREPDPFDDPDAEYRHPHPITPAHERIFKENNMVGAMNAAMDLGNVEELRRLNREYREQYPEDSHLLQAGYDLIADCMERRTAATRVIAERFYDTQIASSLRRYVRIHCLQ